MCTNEEEMKRNAILEEAGYFDLKAQIELLQKDKVELEAKMKEMDSERDHANIRVDTVKQENVKGMDAGRDEEQEDERLRQTVQSVEAESKEVRQAGRKTSEKLFEDLASMQAMIEKKSGKNSSFSSESSSIGGLQGCSEIGSEQVGTLAEQLKYEKEERMAAEVQAKLLEHQLEKEKEARMNVEQQLHDALLENVDLVQAATYRDMKEDLQIIMHEMKSVDSQNTMDFIKKVMCRKLLEANVDLAQAQAQIATLKQEKAELVHSSRQMREGLYTDRQELQALVARSILKMKKKMKNQKVDANAKAKAEIAIQVDANAKAKVEIAILKKDNANLQHEIACLKQENPNLIQSSSQNDHVNLQNEIACLKQENANLMQSSRQMFEEFHQERENMKELLAQSCKTKKKTKDENMKAAQAEINALKQENEELAESSRRMSAIFSKDQEEMEEMKEILAHSIQKSKKNKADAYLRAQAKIDVLKQEKKDLVHTSKRMSAELKEKEANERKTAEDVPENPILPILGLPFPFSMNGSAPPSFLTANSA